MSMTPMSPPARLGGPGNLVLAATVARRYFVDRATKLEIAEELQISRFKVARLIDQAIEQGLVRIEISYPGTLDVDLSSRLQAAFGLRHAIVVDTPDDDEKSLRDNLGRAGADLLTEILGPEDVLGLAWARSVGAVAAHLRRLPPIPVVQLTGALFDSAGDHGTLDDSSVDVVRRVAGVSGGRAYLFFAPFLVDDATAASSLRRQPDVARALGAVSTVTKALVGIGAWAPGQSTLYDASADTERRALSEQGVCADVGGVFITEDGTLVHTPLSDRMVGIEVEGMRTIPEVIGIPYGLGKTPAVLAAVRSGAVDSLVTHTALAHALLERARPEDRPGAGRPEQR
jgi:DNA-binding transcriptional regulator LsrR (DeoR family)